MKHPKITIYTQWMYICKWRNKNTSRLLTNSTQYIFPIFPCLFLRVCHSNNCVGAWASRLKTPPTHANIFFALSLSLFFILFVNKWFLVIRQFFIQNKKYLSFIKHHFFLNHQKHHPMHHHHTETPPPSRLAWHDALFVTYIFL